MQHGQHDTDIDGHDQVGELDHDGAGASGANRSSTAAVRLTSLNVFLIVDEEDRWAWAVDFYRANDAAGQQGEHPFQLVARLVVGVVARAHHRVNCPARCRPSAQRVDPLHERRSSVHAEDLLRTVSRRGDSVDVLESHGILHVRDVQVGDLRDTESLELRGQARHQRLHLALPPAHPTAPAASGAEKRRVCTAVPWGTGSGYSRPNTARSDSGFLLLDTVESALTSRIALIDGVQRRLRIGYNRAARLMEEMEDKGIVGPENGSSPREILVDLCDQQKRVSGYRACRRESFSARPGSPALD